MANATLDGKTLLDGDASWSLRAGVAPSMAEFELIPEDAAALMTGGLRPVTLRLGGPGAESIEITNLYVLQERPAATPHTRKVLVADRRHFWPSKHVNRMFNARRNVGIKRVKAGFKVPELSPLEPKIQYGAWSIKNGTVPWSAEEALKAIFETIQEAEKEVGSGGPSLIVESDISGLTYTTLPLQDMELADDGAAAVQRLLNFIPGAEITVDADGSVRVYSIASGAEAEIMDAMLPEQEGGGHAIDVSNARLRPRKINVLFAPETEMKFTFQEFGPDDTFERSPTATYMENVLPVPDYSLEVPGVGTVSQGTWITINQALLAWSTDGSGVTLTIANVRKAMVPGMDLWTGLLLSQLGNAKAAWASRVAALQTHYRRTYRINQNVVRRMRSLRAYRTATINPQTGSRAPATAFQDWAVVATQRFLATQLAGGAGDFAYCENVDGYPDGGRLDKDAIVAPVNVTVEDSDQGIIRLEFKPDPFRVREQFLPSKVENIPTGRISSGLVAWNSLEPGQQPPELSSTHRVAIVLTVVPAAPNSQERLFRVEKSPSDIRSLLPSSLRSGLTDAKGPTLDVFVGPGWEMARIAWADRQENRIKAAFGFGGENAKGDVTSLKDLVVNFGAQKGLGNTAASLDAIANSVAAAIYAGHADRIEGSRTTPLTHAARVAGFVETVIHSVFPDGEVSSTVTIMRQKKPLDLMSMMPTHTRAIILKQVTSETTV